MWCDIDKSKMPIIKVNFKDESQVESDFDKLLDEWLSFYDRKIPFYFVFDTRNLNKRHLLEKQLGDQSVPFLLL